MRRDPGVSIQVHILSAFIDKIIKKEMTMEELHNPFPNYLYHAFRLFRTHQQPGSLCKDIEFFGFNFESLFCLAVVGNFLDIRKAECTPRFFYLNDIYKPIRYMVIIGASFRIHSRLSTNHFLEFRIDKNQVTLFKRSYVFQKMR